MAAVARGMRTARPYRRGSTHVSHARAGVLTVHDLHVWSLGATRVALTAHLVMPTVGNDDRFIDDLTHALDERSGIAHATRQIETGDCEHRCNPDA